MSRRSQMSLDARPQRAGDAGVSLFLRAGGEGKQVFLSSLTLNITEQHGIHHQPASKALKAL